MLHAPSAASPGAEPVVLPTARSNPFDPPAELAHWRGQGPLRRLAYPDGHLGWLVIGDRLARAVLTDPRFSARADLIRSPVRRPGAEPFLGQPALPGWFVDMDPPEHTRFRRLLAGQFTVRRMNDLRPRVERIVDDHLDAMERAGPPVDLVQAFALPVPSLTICELLGVAYADRGEFQRHSTTLFSLDSSAEDGAAAMRALTDYLRHLVRHKRNHPADDLMSRLAEADGLTDDEAAGVGVLLLTAGHETVASMLGLGAFLLLRHPDQAAALRSGRAGVDQAVEELLRYLSIFHLGVPRTAVDDVELHACRIRAGECVTIMLPAANRDPDRFDDPDRLDLARPSKGHLALGYGVHQCLGQHLARVELKVGYAALLRRFPTLRLAVPAETVAVGGAGFYGVHRLPVAW